MASVPFLALHGVKVFWALVVFAAGVGVFHYLRRPAVRARRRRRALGSLRAASPRDLTAGDAVTLEGTLVADQDIAPAGRPAAVACVVRRPGGDGEIRHTVSGGALAVEVEGRRIPLEGDYDLRSGSQEFYARFPLAFAKPEWRKGLRASFGEDSIAHRATALLELRQGEDVSVQGRAHPRASRRTSGYRESQSDWSLVGDDEGEIALWHRPAPATAGSGVLGAVWRALWAGGLAMAGLAGAGHLSLMVESDDLGVLERTAGIASLSPWSDERAADRYQKILLRLEPTRERGRAIARLYELHDHCDYAARELFMRQDLEGAVAVSERCPSDVGDRAAVAAHLLEGDVEEAARRAEDIHIRDELRLLLSAGAWKRARELIAGPQPMSFLPSWERDCLDAWLGTKLGESPALRERRRGCASLRGDVLEGRERLEFLAEEHPDGLKKEVPKLLALEALAVADREETASESGVQLAPAKKAEIREHVWNEVNRVTTGWSNVFDHESLWSAALRDLSGLLGANALLRARIGEPASELPEPIRWRFAPGLLSRAALAALRRDFETARSLLDRAHAELRSMNRGDPYPAESPDATAAVFREALAFLGGEAPRRGRNSESATHAKFGWLLAQRGACSAGQPRMRRSRYERACAGDTQALLAPHVDRVRVRAELLEQVPGHAREMLLAIGPVIGPDPSLARSLSVMPLLPYRPPTTVSKAYVAATHMWFIYDSLGHPGLTRRWRERSLHLQEILLSREAAVPLAVLD